MVYYLCNSYKVDSIAVVSASDGAVRHACLLHLERIHQIVSSQEECSNNGTLMRENNQPPRHIPHSRSFKIKLSIPRPLPPLHIRLHRPLILHPPRRLALPHRPLHPPPHLLNPPPTSQKPLLHPSIPRPLPPLHIRLHRPLILHPARRLALQHRPLHPRPHILNPLRTSQKPLLHLSIPRRSQPPIALHHLPINKHMLHIPNARMQHHRRNGVAPPQHPRTPPLPHHNI